jgi:hypothetical protein
VELSNTLKYINLAGVNIGLVALRGPIHLCVCVREKRGDGEGVVRTRPDTWTHQCHRLRNRTGCVVWTDAPACMCERGAWGRGGSGLASTIRYT